jgi:hypothetical protein
MTRTSNRNRARTAAFGTHTTFARAYGGLWASAKLSLLRIVKTERQARSLGSLHFAYWVRLPRRRLARLTELRRRAGAIAAPRRDQLLFLSDFSGDWEVYLAGFNRVLRHALDAVWNGSVGWKPEMELNEYLAYVRAHQVSAEAYFQAYGSSADVHDVRSALHVSEQLDRFAYDTDGELDPARFYEAYKQLLIRLGGHLAC